MVIESWRNVVGYEGRYMVSDLGRVKSLVSTGRWPNGDEGRIMRQGIARKRGGARYIVLCKGGAKRTVKVHRLVLEAFVGPCPGGMECAHRDGDPSNNRLGNLSWKTGKDNQADRLEHGTDIRGEDHVNAKLSDAAVVEIRKRRECGETYRSLAASYGVSHTLVIRVIQRAAWAHVSVPS